MPPSRPVPAMGPGGMPGRSEGGTRLARDGSLGDSWFATRSLRRVGLPLDRGDLPIPEGAIRPVDDRLGIPGDARHLEDDLALVPRRQLHVGEASEPVLPAR